MSDKTYSAYGGDKIIDLENEQIAEAFGGSSSGFAIDFDYNWNDHKVNTCNKTIVEIAALSNNANTIPTVHINGSICPVLFYKYSNNYVYMLIGVYLDGLNFNCVCFDGYVSSSGNTDSWDAYEYYIAMTKNVS